MCFRPSATCANASATRSGSVIIRSWPVSMSQSRPSARAAAIRAASLVASVEVHTMWYCGIAHNASSLRQLERLVKHCQGCPVSRSAIQARSSGSVTP